MLDLDSPLTSSPDAADAVREALADRVRGVLQARTNGTSRLVRVGVSLPRTVDPLRWLRAQDGGEAAYWSARNGDAPVGMVGVADVVESDDHPIDYDGLQRQLAARFDRAEAPLRYYGGVRFDAAHPGARSDGGEGWDRFRTYRFVLPRFELHSRADGATLVCNLVLPRDAGRDAAILEAVRGLSFPDVEAPGTLPEPFGRTDVPDRDGWTRMVRWALDAIAERSLDKVVLARRVALELGTPLDPFFVLQHLKEATPACFHFAVRPASGSTFLGASPERLFRRDGDRVVSEAVAGTRERGDTPEADAALRDELMESPKERREHAFVQEAIREKLEGLCTAVDAPDAPSDLALARGRHLHARLTGTLRSGTTPLDLLDALHPTPAVGGVPTDAALAAIRTQEPFDRGWYAGPVGWIGADAAEFAVAIRSGLVQDDRLALFSGAGIVDGSEPAREWDEIEQKIGDFASILGLDGHAAAA
jgi:menaquinone-specific isochorismate synthase